MKRVVIISDGFPPFDLGGAERIAYYDACALRDAGFEVAVATLGDVKEEKCEQREGLTVFTSPRRRVLNGAGHLQNAEVIALSIYNPLYIGFLRDVAESVKPDFAHAHMVSELSLGGIVRAFAKAKRFVTFHGFTFECPRGGLIRRNGEICDAPRVPCGLYSIGMRQVLASFHRIIAIAEFVKERMQKAGIPSERIVLLRNGLPDGEVSDFREVPRSQNILFVGRVEKNKGVGCLLEAFGLLKRPDARLQIIGDGGMRGVVEAAMQRDPRIEYLGRISHDNIAHYYRGARVVVVPSVWHELMNTVICEAQRWGCPVIATRLGGNPELIEDGKTGILVEPNRAAELEYSIRSIVDDDALADRLGMSAREAAAAWSLATHSRRLLSIYRGEC